MIAVVEEYIWIKKQRKIKIIMPVSFHFQRHLDMLHYCYNVAKSEA